jgi:hypothetical protein
MNSISSSSKKSPKYFNAPESGTIQKFIEEPPMKGKLSGAGGGFDDKISLHSSSGGGAASSSMPEVVSPERLDSEPESSIANSLESLSVEYDSSPKSIVGLCCAIHSTAALLLGKYI